MFVDGTAGGVLNLEKLIGGNHVDTDSIDVRNLWKSSISMLKD